ncbi:MAG TPA: hypothetical protein VGE51_10250 [Fontimonas sp.]
MNDSKRLALVMLAAAGLIAACDSNNNRPQTTTQIVIDEIDRNTGDDALPIVLNDLPISDDDTDESSLPMPVL